MHVICGISGISFNCDYFPGSLQSREYVHPIFYIPQRALIPYARKWASQELTETDTYLYFLALLNSTELVDFRVPVHRTTETHKIVTSNMESLLKIIYKMNSINHPSIVFPHIVISPNNCELETVSYWLQSWEDIYTEFKAGTYRAIAERELLKRETVIERLIRNPYRPLKSYSNQLANWAATAASFPTFSTVDRFTDQSVSCSDYWIHCINRLSTEGPFSVPLEDIEEIAEHCSTNLPLAVGSILTRTVLKLLRDSIKSQSQFLHITETDTLTPTTKNVFTIIDTVEEKETALLDNLADNAPQTEPQQKDYPNKIAYIRAKLSWDQAKKKGLR